MDLLLAPLRASIQWFSQAKRTPFTSSRHNSNRMRLGLGLHRWTMAISSLLQSKILSSCNNEHNTDMLLLCRDAVSAGNKFVETCLRFSLQVIQQRMGTAVLNEYLQQGFEITIVGDNDFYSQRAQVKRKASFCCQSNMWHIHSTVIEASITKYGRSTCIFGTFLQYTQYFGLSA